MEYMWGWLLLDYMQEKKKKKKARFLISKVYTVKIDHKPKTALTLII